MKLVYTWNDQRWVLDNSYNAIVRAGPWTDEDALLAALVKADDEHRAQGFGPDYVSNRTRIVEVEYPNDTP